MNKSVYKYKFLFASLFVFIFLLLSFQVQAGDVKIIIGGYGDGKHYYKSHKKYYNHYDQSVKHRYYNKSRYNYKHRLGYGEHYYGKKYYRNKYYGNNYRYKNRGYYRGDRNYCPY